MSKGLAPLTPPISIDTFCRMADLHCWTCDWKKPQKVRENGAKWTGQFQKIIFKVTGIVQIIRWEYWYYLYKSSTDFQRKILKWSPFGFEFEAMTNHRREWTLICICVCVWELFIDMFKSIENQDTLNHTVWILICAPLW